MSNSIKRNIFESSLIAGALLVTSVVGANVAHAETTADNLNTQNTSNTNQSIVNKNNILSVANHDNESLKQIADNNNVDVSVLEGLNDNVDPNKSLPDGTPIYLPQNVDNEPEINIPGAVSFSTSSNPYHGVTAYLKHKYYDNLSPADLKGKLYIAGAESTNNYEALNYPYVGRFQLNVSYFNGDTHPSKEAQEKAALSYVKSHYGTWAKAASFRLHSKISSKRLNKAGYVFRIPKNQVKYYESVNFTKTNLGNNPNKLSKKDYVEQLSKNNTDFKVINAKQNGPQFMYKLSNKNNTINCWVDWSYVYNKYLDNKKFKVLANKENDFSDPDSKITYNQLKTLANRFKGKDKKVAQTSLKETLNYKKSHEEIYDTPSLLHIG